MILKCYPKYQKNVTDVKPNSSELSMLSFYTSTRKSKIPKVGAYLEKKTSSDVYKKRVE
jgi:protein EFR3